MKQIILAMAVSALSCAATAQTLTPLRAISGNTVVSHSDPVGTIEVVPAATYVGAVRFVMFGSADCEIHLFVDADQDKRIRRLFWVQFEAYLPSHPELQYSMHPAYSAVGMSGLPFYQRARFGLSSDVPQPGSDAEKAYGLLREHGYTLPAQTVNVTYKHFLGTDMRKEIMLIVLDDMATTGTTFAELVQGGKLQPGWAPVAEQLLARAAGVFTVKIPAAPSN